MPTVDWIRNRLAELYPQLDTEGYEVTGRIIRLAQTIETKRSEQLATHGLTAGEFDVLATVRRSDTGEGINPGTFLESLVITSGGLSKRLDRLETAGLIERNHDPNDRRGTLIRLTPSGLKLIDQVLPMVVDRESAEIKARLTLRQLEQAAALLRKLSQADRPT
jgi:DNA-binding MarR family transcriptional regulator